MINHKRIEILVSSYEKNLQMAIYNAGRYSCLLEQNDIRSHIYISCPHKSNSAYPPFLVAYASIIESKSIFTILYLRDSGTVASLLASIRYIPVDRFLLVIDDCLPHSINTLGLKNAISKIVEEKYDYIRLNRRGVCISSRTHNPKWLPYYLSITTAFVAKDLMIWLLERSLTLWESERCYLDIPVRFKVLPASLAHLFNPPVTEVHCLRGCRILTLKNKYSTLCRSLGYELMPLPRRLYDHCYNIFAPFILTLIAFMAKVFEKLDFIDR